MSWSTKDWYEAGLLGELDCNGFSALRTDGILFLPLAASRAISRYTAVFKGNSWYTYYIVIRCVSCKIEHWIGICSGVCIQSYFGNTLNRKKIKTFSLDYWKHAQSASNLSTKALDWLHALTIYLFTILQQMLCSDILEENSRIGIFDEASVFLTMRNKSSMQLKLQTLEPHLRRSNKNDATTKLLS